MDCGTKWIKGGKGLSGLTVPELREILKKANKPQGGNRAELCKRINDLKVPIVSSRASPTKSSSPSRTQSPIRKSKRINIPLIDSKEKSSSPRSPRSPKGKESLKEGNVSSSRSPRSPKGKENPITEPAPAEISLQNLRRQKIRHEKETNLFEALNQPFPKNYGLLEDGTFEEDMIYFASSFDMQVSSYRVNAYQASNRGNKHFYDLIGLGDRFGNPRVILFENKIGEDCVQRASFVTKSLQEIWEESNDSPYLADLYDRTKDLVYSEPPIVYEHKLGASSINTIKKCISSDAKMLYLLISIETYRGSHAVQVILNIGQKKGWYFDSSQHQRDYELYRECIEVFLRHYIDVNYTLEKYDFETCPAIDLQGQYGTCAAWTLYIFALAVLNPELTEFDIVKMINSYDETTKDFIIITFYWFFFNYSEPLEESSVQMKARNHPRQLPYLGVGEKLTFTRQ